MCLLEVILEYLIAKDGEKVLRDLNVPKRVADDIKACRNQVILIQCVEVGGGMHNVAESHYHWDVCIGASEGPKTYDERS